MTGVWAWVYCSCTQLTMVEIGPHEIAVVTGPQQVAVVTGPQDVAVVTCPREVAIVTAASRAGRWMMNGVEVKTTATF